VPATVTLGYDDSGLTTAQEQQLRLVRFDEDTGTYEVIDNATVDTGADRISGTTTHLSGFGVGFPGLDLEVVKTASAATAVPGATVAFTITVTNRGSSGATQVVVTDVLPDGL